jgi:shikimate kinase
LKKNLVLTGMMGVGKSTIGNLLSLKLNMNLIDIDKMIEIKESMPINAIFEKKGEKYFRKLEKELTLKTIAVNNSIIALGGGAFIDKDIRETVLKSCTSFWLDVELDTLVARLKDSKKRPLLKNIDIKQTLSDLYKLRKKIYRESNFKINCNKDEKSLIVEKIINLYESK